MEGGVLDAIETGRSRRIMAIALLL